MDDVLNARAAFWVCLGASVVGIVLTTFAFRGPSNGVQLERALSCFSAGVAPIVVYYGIVWRQLGHPGSSTTDTSIDAVYYLGFLVTLATLLSTVIGYAVLGSNPAAINVFFVAVSFGASLAATGFALAFRIDLMQRRDALSAFPDPDSLFTASTLRLEDAYRRLATVMDDASSLFTQQLTRTNAGYAEQIAGIVQQAHARIADFVQNASTDFATHQRAMTDASATLATTLAENNTAVVKRTSDTLQTSSSAFVDAATQLTASLVKAGRDIGKLIARFEVIDGSTAAASKNVEALGTTAQFASESARSLGQALAALSSGANLDLEPLHAGIGRLRDSVSRLDAATTDAEQHFVSASRDATTSVRARTDELQKATEMLSGAFVKLSIELRESARLLSER